MSKPIVFIVDDDESTREILSHIVEKADCIPENILHEAQLMNTIVEMLPKLVIMDIGLPKVDGLTLVKKLQGMPVAKKIPVMIVTGQEIYEYGNLKKKAEELNCVEFVKKPFNIEKMVELIKGIVFS